MKIIKSKYSSVEMERIYDDAENRLGASLSICFGVLFAIVLVASLWLWSDSLKQKCCTESLLENTVLALLITTKTVLFLFAMYYLFTGFISSLFSFLQKRVRILSNHSAETNFLSYLKLVRAGEELSRLLENNPETRYSYQLKESSLSVFEANDSSMSVVKKIALPEFGCKIISDASDILDFSVCDEDIDTFICSAREKAKKKDSEHAGGEIDERN